MTFGADAISFRVGVFDLADIVPHVSDTDSFAIEVLNVDGIPVVVHVRSMQKWNGRGWHPLLACPQCGSPSRVLEVREDVATCARCVRRVTAHHRRKNRRDWRAVEVVADRVLRRILKPRNSNRVIKVHAEASRLRRASTTQAGFVLAIADRALRAVDELRRRGDLY